MRPGQLVYVRYDEPLWHARLLLAVVRDATWVILTPDLDMYAEELSSANLDIYGIRVGRADGALPLSLRGMPLYAFDPGDLPSGAELREWISEGRGLAQLEGAVGDTFDDRVWVYAEAKSPHMVGDPIAQTLEAEVGHRGLVRIDEAVVLVELASPERVRSMKTEVGGSSGSDARVLPVAFSENGVQFRPWAEVAARSEESVVEHWPIKGPRAAGWVGRFLARRNTAPDDHHRWWRSTARLGGGDWGVAEHAQLCRFLQLAGTFDQLDLSNNSVLEAISRRLQVIEWQYRD